MAHLEKHIMQIYLNQAKFLGKKLFLKLSIILTYRNFWTNRINHCETANAFELTDVKNRQ
jgi:hypothetical protein